jgi:hypothetical protein
MKNIKTKIVKYFTQKYADFLIMQLENNKENQEVFDMIYEKSCQLNAYCIINHDIYLD